ncbi:MAG: hypothetical protein ACRC37_04465 [Lentisphaeria bacterium]
MLELKNCIHCGRKIPAKIVSERYFCSPNCHRKYFEAHGDPRFRIKEFYIRDYGQARVNFELSRDSELEQLFNWTLPARSQRTNKNAKYRKRYDANNSQNDLDQ